MTNPRPSGAYDFVPKLGELRDNMLFGDIWERPGLSKRDRSLITCAVLTAMYRTDELKGHLARAVQNGVTKQELSEMITHVALYAGWPTGVNASRTASEVLGSPD